MAEFPIQNESARLAMVDRLAGIGTGPEPAFDRIATVAGRLFDVPVAAVTLLGADHQWFKGRCGTELAGTPREDAFCNYTVLHDSVFVVPDARLDARFAGNPLVNREGGIRFYAGAPLSVSRDIRVGALCIIDTRPRDLDPEDGRRLSSLARVAVGELWLSLLGPLPRDHLAFEAPDAHFDFAPDTRMTSAQLRAARALLDWSIADLARVSGISASTIKRLESSRADLPVTATTLLALRNALERSGVALVGEPHRQPGVRLR